MTSISKEHFIEVFASSGVQSAVGRACINCHCRSSKQYHVMLWIAKSLSFCAGYEFSRETVCVVCFIMQRSPGEELDLKWHYMLLLQRVTSYKQETCH